MDFKYIKKEITHYILIFVGVFAFKSSFFEPNHIPSGSMLPTLAIGDFILVNKMSYGFKIPYSDTMIFGIGDGKPTYINKFTPPERGDIAVFRYPKNPDILFVKRIVGVPGDEIEVFDNQMYLNGKLVDTKPLKKEDNIDVFDEKFGPENLSFHEVNWGDTKFVTTHNDAMPYHLNTREKVVVPEGHLFAMGDNRDFSSDSRVWGFVPFEYVRGKAMFVWFNMVYPWSAEKFHFRPWRIGKSF